MAKKLRVLIAVLLILSIANYMRIGNSENIRTVDFLSILVIGALAGILLVDVMRMLRRKN